MFQMHAILSQCAFHFVAKYQFPIPVERDRPQVQRPEDREWAEWAYLLKRLATKRRIPARVLYDQQIKSLVGVVEHSLEARTSAVKEPEPGSSTNGQTSPVQALKDDRLVLQLISGGIQVAKILMDAVAMEQLDQLYTRTEFSILERRRNGSRC